MSEETADVLAAGREYIEQNGWWRGHLIGPNGQQACAVGGLMRGLHLAATSVEKDPRVLNACFALANVLGAERAYPLQTNIGYVEYWNDHYAKDKQAVLDAFAKAEKIERAGFDPDA
jgi:hypothetical protein